MMTQIAKDALDTLRDFVEANRSDDLPLSGEMAALRALEQAIEPKQFIPTIRVVHGPCDGAGYFPIQFEGINGTRIETLPEGMVFTAGNRGDLVITKNEAGDIVAVTRQDSEGKILEIIAEKGVED